MRLLHLGAVTLAQAIGKLKASRAEFQSSCNAISEGSDCVEAGGVAPLRTPMAATNENWKEKRVLVTGGAGFIGSVLVWELNRRGCSQIAVADFPAGGDQRGNPARFAYTGF